MSNDIPWEDPPPGNTEILWRYSQNPIIHRYDIPSSNSIFNSAVVPFHGVDGIRYAGVFRCDNRAVQMNIHAGFSKDGLVWQIQHDPIKFQLGNNTQFIYSDYKYDPRVTYIEDDDLNVDPSKADAGEVASTSNSAGVGKVNRRGRYWITWCNGYHGPTIGVAYTYDFIHFYQCENAFLPCNRNGVLFPKTINGKYAMLSRPSDYGHTPFGDIFLSFSPDMTFWGQHRCLMKVTPFEISAWQSTKIGAGSVPIETTHGWLIFYHGVIKTCSGFRYSMGAALLDLHDPTNVLYRSKPYLLAPALPYEQVGDVPNVVFPCAAVADVQQDKVAIYYGAADTVVALCFGRLSHIINWLIKNSL